MLAVRREVARAIEAGCLTSAPVERRAAARLLNASPTTQSASTPPASLSPVASPPPIPSYHAALVNNVLSKLKFVGIEQGRWQDLDAARQFFNRSNHNRLLPDPPLDAIAWHWYAHLPADAPTSGSTPHPQLPPPPDSDFSSFFAQVDSFVDEAVEELARNPTHTHSTLHPTPVQRTPCWALPSTESLLLMHKRAHLPSGARHPSPQGGGVEVLVAC